MNILRTSVHVSLGLNEDAVIIKRWQLDNGQQWTELFIGLQSDEFLDAYPRGQWQLLSGINRNFVSITETGTQRKRPWISKEKYIFTLHMLLWHWEVENFLLSATESLDSADCLFSLEYLHFGTWSIPISEPYSPIPWKLNSCTFEIVPSCS